MPILIQGLDSVDAWESNGVGLIPACRGQLAEILYAEETKASTGTDQVELTWSAVGGSYDGMTRKEWLAVTPLTLGKVKAFLLAVGWQLPAGDFEMPVSALVGRRALITVTPEDYGGKTSLRVQAHAPVPTGPDPLGNGGNGVPIDTRGLPPTRTEPNAAPIPF